MEKEGDPTWLPRSPLIPLLPPVFSTRSNTGFVTLLMTHELCRWKTSVISGRAWHPLFLGTDGTCGQRADIWIDDVDDGSRLPVLDSSILGARLGGL